LFSVRPAQRGVFSAFCCSYPARRRRVDFYLKRRKALKTYKHLYPQICSFENLYLAYRKARRGKRGRPGAADFERVQEDELLALQEE
jgi:hypothetical protein